MKKLLIAAALTATLSSPAMAEPKSNEYCANLSGMAAQIMEVRQGGMDMSKVMMISDSKMIQGIVIDAYSMNAYSVGEYRQKSIKNFANKYALACYKLK